MHEEILVLGLKRFLVHAKALALFALLVMVIVDTSDTWATWLLLFFVFLLLVYLKDEWGNIQRGGEVNDAVKMGADVVRMAIDSARDLRKELSVLNLVVLFLLLGALVMYFFDWIGALFIAGLLPSGAIATLLGRSLVTGTAVWVLVLTILPSFIFFTKPKAG